MTIGLLYLFVTQCVTTCPVIDRFYIKIAFEEDTDFAMETMGQAIVLKAIKFAVV